LEHACPHHEEEHKEGKEGGYTNPQNTQCCPTGLCTIKTEHHHVTEIVKKLWYTKNKNLRTYLFYTTAEVHTIHTHKTLPTHQALF
jgi:hypothetical protein